MPKGSWTEFDNSPSDNTSESVEIDQLKVDRSVRVQKTRAGKSGKTVTVITGTHLNYLESKSLLKLLKINCGTGGTLKGGIIELQGDQVDAVINVLLKEGFSPKKAGG